MKSAQHAFKSWEQLHHDQLQEQLHHFSHFFNSMSLQVCLQRFATNVQATLASLICPALKLQWGLSKAPGGIFQFRIFFLQLINRPAHSISKLLRRLVFLSICPHPSTVNPFYSCFAWMSPRLISSALQHSASTWGCCRDWGNVGRSATQSFWCISAVLFVSWWAQTPRAKMFSTEIFGIQRPQSPAFKVHDNNLEKMFKCFCWGLSKLKQSRVLPSDQKIPKQNIS